MIISYGIPTGIVILIPIFFITFNSINKILNTKARESSSIYDQSWIAALVVLFFSQMVDVQYFDGRISIIFWILLSGSSNIIKKDKETVY